MSRGLTLYRLCGVAQHGCASWHRSQYHGACAYASTSTYLYAPYDGGSRSYEGLSVDGDAGPYDAASAYLYMIIDSSALL